MQKKTAYKIMLIKEMQNYNINFFNVFYIIYNFLFSLHHQKDK